MTNESSFASADKIRCCPHCQCTFERAFGVPQFWWSQYCQNSNGFFGYDDNTYTAGSLSRNTWARFEVKILSERMQYNWTTILVFDAEPSLFHYIRDSFMNTHGDYDSDPFSAYVHLVQEVVRLQDTAVWAVRDCVRAIEKGPRPAGKPEPDYRYFHDMARHATHVTETLDTALGTMDAMLSQHDAIKSELSDTRSWSRVHQPLLFFRNILGSLRCRSHANEKRLANEIQLVFHTVAQYDAGVSVAVGKAAREDSAAMKTIATLTMVFLPPTFVSAMFSMSFFNFDSEAGWRVSEKYWIYWAFAAPITLATYLWWFRWQRSSGAKLAGES
ncbi:uncharacterized protein PG986_005629 [Apiospora aurea]|uniref:Uncharacterized protein n=1 Tax=Apiospora aurea TaxID=335848 RepID=A0ABR1QI40_9PEZI